MSTHFPTTSMFPSNLNFQHQKFPDRDNPIINFCPPSMLKPLKKNSWSSTRDKKMIYRKYNNYWNTAYTADVRKVRRVCIMNGS